MKSGFSERPRPCIALKQRKKRHETKRAIAQSVFLLHMEVKGRLCARVYLQTLLSFELLKIFTTKRKDS